MTDPVAPYSFTRTTVDGLVSYTFTPRGKSDTLTLDPSNYQSGSAMRAYVMAWIATLD
ncbi:hypothetical protein [Loktanella sp. R86503]|uniref:hypothetical protein n=1 Tax=Loktanella sp. R86503 TaxID=3093847 RepID=UPI0036D89962